MIHVDMHMQVHMHQDGMNRHKIFIVLVVMLFSTSMMPLFGSLHPCKADTPPTLYVGKGETYAHIQDALDNVTADGYRIFVYNGTYIENLTINYSIDLFGEDRGITIIDGNGTGTVITVNADHVNISHFTVTNGGQNSKDSLIQVNQRSSIITDNIISDGYTGVYLNNSDGHLIYDNVIQNNKGAGLKLNQSNNNINISYNTFIANDNGIFFHSSNGNKIYNNIIQYNTANGVFLNRTCDGNYVVNNNCSYNNHSGIYVNDYSDYSTILNNQIYENSDSGIKAENCSRCIIAEGNIIQKNTNYGVMIIGSYNAIQNNVIASNRQDGMYCSVDQNNTISNNIIASNLFNGIRLDNSTNDYIYTNEIFGNDQYGIYLDFYTLRNNLYNNYFHDNAVNAMDKSFLRNIWNTTKHAGTSIVGGSYISGNYWDTFDETAEGAYDNNSDGIADGPYTIYAQNKDYGALLDTIPPTLGIPQVSPSSQSLGSYTNISVMVTDNTKIHQVYLELINPLNQTSNFSILHNKTGDTYYCRKQFPLVGNYSFIIAAKDPRNWVQTTNGTFSIKPGIPPVIKDNSPSTGSPAARFTFNASVTSSNTNPSNLRVYVIWNHSAKGDNQTLNNTAGNYFTKTITLDHSIANLTYYFYATDQWGNAISTSLKKIQVVDNAPPEIRILKHGPSSEDIPNSYTFQVLVTDNSVVSNVTIEYWYENTTKMTAKMDRTTQNYTYHKVITAPETTQQIFCVIYAIDIAGNQVNTTRPYASPGGPYNGFVLQKITMDGTHSYDLDGTIVDYRWDFGDGTTGNSSTPTHIYYANGTYTITLTVVDNDGNNGTNTTTIHIGGLSRHTLPISQLDFINAQYQMTLTEPFYCCDLNGDSVVDTFFDPNERITTIRGDPVRIEGSACFLLSVDHSKIPAFFWNTDTDSIAPITHTEGTFLNKTIDDDLERATIRVMIEKTGWVYLETSDTYPEATLTVMTGSRVIPSNLIWRDNGTIYVLDDPGTEYFFRFDHIFPPLESSFSPPDGGVINADNPTITIAYTRPVMIVTATFATLDMKNELTTSDDMTFTYTPPGYLANGTYTLIIDAQALEGNGFQSSTMTYFYFQYQLPPQKSFLEQYGMILAFIGFMGAIGALLVVLKKKHITVDAFIYIKNRKIIPFFKPVIVGPMSVQIDDSRLKKAEFYIDGNLKGETTTFPSRWQWDEKAFLKHTIETKVYDDDGNGVSSGAMEFYIFNPLENREHSTMTGEPSSQLPSESEN
jgi:parallel beta-helix repeat protein